MVKINNLSVDQNSVPVLIDDFKNSSKIQMTRCNYFSIENDSPSLGWTLQLSTNQIPFLMIGLSGIITQSVSGEYFTSPDTIRSLFEVIEGHPDLYVDINEIWLPNNLFSREPNRGDVYRINYELFTMAIKFQNKQIQLEKYTILASDFRSGITFSEKETIVFKAWEREIIVFAKETYPKNKDFALKWSE